MSDILASKYIIIKKIGHGSFGDVYVAVDRVEHKTVALKIESNKCKIPRLAHEYALCKLFEKCKGFPRPFSLIKTNTHNVMAMSLFGADLEYKLKEEADIFNEQVICTLAIQMINILKIMHDNGYIHRDIKPNNFVCDHIGTNIRIIDFGLSKSYVTSKGKHIPFKMNKTLIGTARYVGINTHYGFEYSRRDDLESVAYVLIYLFRGRLPWQGNKKCANFDEQLDLICEQKTMFKTTEYFNTLPTVLKKYLCMCRSMAFMEKPDYDKLTALFSDNLRCIEDN